MLFLQAQTVADSWIIIDKDLLLHEVNGTVFAPDDFTEHRELTRTGVVTYSRIYEVFENAIKSKKIDPQLIVHFLIHMEFCQEVKEVDKNVLKLVTETHPMHEKEQYFLFPALTKPEPPRDLWRSNPLISYSEYSSCWVLQCHGHQHYIPQPSLPSGPAPQTGLHTRPPCGAPRGRPHLPHSPASLHSLEERHQMDHHLLRGCTNRDQ